MNYFELNDFDSDSEDDYDYFSEEIIEEMILDSKLKSVSLFKKHIDKDPEFYGINNIIDFVLLNIIDKGGKSSNNILNEYQIELFDDLYKTLGKKGKIENYNYVYEQILNKIQV